MLPDRSQALRVAIAMALLATGCSDSKLETQRQQARATAVQWADRLDAQTTEAGVYIRHEGETLPDSDPWGKKLEVTYSRGGVAEIIKVASAGPDGVFGSEDDIIEQRQSTNLAGVGEGLKKNAQELASETGKGMVKGMIDGVKESFSKPKAEEGDE